MISDVLIIPLDDLKLLLGRYQFFHDGKHPPARFRLVGIFVEYLLHFLRDREYHLTGTFISIPRLIAIESYLLSMSSEIPFIIG